MSTNYTKTDADNEGYCVVSLGEVERDWVKVTLINRLLRTNWTVYRNTTPLNNYPAGSFFIPLGGLPISKDQTSAYLEEQALEIGIPLAFHKEALPTEGLTKLQRPRLAVLYATAEKWALMTMNVLETMGFEVHALSAEDIHQGALDHANILFIPGGSHSDKANDVGTEGEAKVKEFVEKGGGLLAFCGGAALTAQVKDGWGLLAVEREPRKVPKAMHGPIWIKPETSDHPLWYGYPSRGFPLAPWYGKALHPLNEEVRVLGRYDRPTDDFYVAHELTGSYFSEYLPEEIETLDKVYDGYANPANLKGMVAIAEGEYGAGRIIIGYPHPETPGLEGGFLLLANAIYHVTQNPPADDSHWLSSSVTESSYNEAKVLSLLAAVKDVHSSQVLPISKDIVKFGINNLYWTPRPHIDWSYIAIGGRPFYICERMEAYCDEILRQLDELPLLINEINAKRERLLTFGEQPQVKESLKQANELLDNAYRSGGSALSEILEYYHSRIETSLADWALKFKKILLYHQLLAIMKAKDADSNMVDDISKKNRELSGECIGSWRWALASEKYQSIFFALDTTSYYLSNLKFGLEDISLKLDYLLLITR
ncbi:MAG: hypothetical protein WC369_02910 [Dehalococcoidales bacterium]|jgi:hypothetical protein